MKSLRGDGLFYSGWAVGQCDLAIALLGQRSRYSFSVMRTAVCVIVKNEAPTLGEWLAYHAEVGFDAALVYDNGSFDATQVVARAHRGLLSVRIVDWPNATQTWQVDAYADALQRFSAEFDWIAFVDADEFIRLAKGVTLRTLLSMRADDWAIALPWKIFGSSGHVEKPADLVIASYTQRAASHRWPSRHIKSLVRPSAVLQVVNPHAMIFRATVAGSTGYVWPDGRPLLGWRGGIAGLAEELSDAPLAWVNHYFTKSRSEWAIKVARGYNGETRDPAEFAKYDYKEVCEEMPPVLIEAVRKAIASVAEKAPPAIIPEKIREV